MPQLITVSLKKSKVWGARGYAAPSKLVVLKKREDREGRGRYTAKDCVEKVMHNELFDFWTGSNGIGGALVMEDGADYHESASQRV